MGMSPQCYSPMRILIADSQAETRIKIDRLLGAYGYFRICPVSSFDELTVFTHFSPAINERFDLLIINATLLADANIDASKFCVNNSRLRSVLLYDAPHLVTINGGKLSNEPQHPVLALASLNYGQLIEFLNAIDSRSVTDCRSVKTQANTERLETHSSSRVAVEYSIQRDDPVCLSPTTPAGAGEPPAKRAMAQHISLHLGR